MSECCAVSGHPIAEIPMISEGGNSVFRRYAGELDLFSNLRLRWHLEGDRRRGCWDRCINNLGQLDGVRRLIVEAKRFVVHRQRLIWRERVQQVVRMPFDKL